MTWAIINKVSGFYYSGKRWRWSSTPKIYAKIGWAKSALTGLQKQTWNKNSKDYEIIEYPFVANFNIYKWRNGGNCAVFVNGQYKTTYLHDYMNVEEVYDFVPEKSLVTFSFFDLPEDDDQEIYFDEHEYCEDEEVYKKWMETH